MQYHTALSAAWGLCIGSDFMEELGLEELSRDHLAEN